MNADLIIVNGKLYSVDLAGVETRAEAIAVKDGKIISIGSRSDVEFYKGSETKIIDAAGGSILPGLSDAHVHASFTASGMFAANLFSCEGKTVDETIENIKRQMVIYMKEHPHEAIVRGTGWNSAILTMGRMPTRFDLDDICPDKPMILESYCQHFNWINTKAMETAGIDNNTPTPHTAVIYRDESGMPLGIFGEFAGIHLVRDRLGSDFSAEEYRKTLELYQNELANRYGVTLIFDAYCSENGRAAYKAMAEEGALTMRVKGNYYADPSKDSSQFDEMIARKKAGHDDINDLYSVNTVKFFMEGSGTGFYMTQPFEKEFLEATGLSEDLKYNAFWTDEMVKESFYKLNMNGFQIHTHAMGDGAVRQSIDGFAYAKRHGAGDVRNTIAHLMYVQPDDIIRMGENDIIGCVQPTWMTQEPISGPGCIAMMGMQRYLDFYPYKRLIEAGCVTSAGTDYPVTPPPDPFISIEHAITRSMHKGCRYDKDGLYHQLKLGPQDDPERDCVGLKEAIASLTIGTAYQCFLEDVTGSLEVGKSADLVLLDNDIESVPVEEIHDLNAVKTIFKGRIVYEE